MNDGNYEMSVETYTTYGQEKVETEEWTLKHTVLSSWDNYFPPLNLFNYSLHWKWIEEWTETNEDDI